MTKSRPHIGLLGGGQLARMLALKGHELGLIVHVLSADTSDPAAQVVRFHHLGDPGSYEALESFLDTVEVATFESEFLDNEILGRAVDHAQKPVRPYPQLMGLLQDRLSQKQLLEEHKIPTLPFAAVDEAAPAHQFLEKHKTGIVLKKRRFGYDGYGTFHARTKPEIDAIFAQKSARDQFIAEPRCPFRRELAITVVRDSFDRLIAYPLVETKQQNSRCLWVKGPIRHRAAGPLLARLKRFLRRIDYVGAMSFELFETPKGLLINEVAPRVHNSAHCTLDAFDLDQFSAHLLAIAGEKLPEPKPRAPGYAMMNLLGRGTTTPHWELSGEVHLHWYGKLDNRPGRKLGHLNALAKSADEALSKVRRAERKFHL